MQKVLYIQPIHPRGMEKLAEKYNVVVAPDTSRETLEREIADAAAVVSRLTVIDAALMEKGGCLKAIAKHGVGTDNFDVEYAKAHGIEVLTTGNANSSTVAEHTMFAIGALLKRIPMLDREMRKGNWKSRDIPGAADARGRALGILGFGRIGRCLAKMAHYGFDMEVYVYDPFLSEDGLKDTPYHYCATVEEVMRASDIVSPHVPLTGETRNLVSRERIFMMKRGSYIVNFARGGVVDQQALEEALDCGQIAGAALDTFETEPPETACTLFARENVILSPHCGTFTEDSRERMSMRLAEEIDRVLSRGE